MHIYSGSSVVQRSLSRVLMVCFLGLGASNIVFSQPEKTSLWQKLLSSTAIDTVAPDGRAKLVGYPTLAYSPETSWEIGVSAAFLFYAKRNPQENRLSRIDPFFFYTLKGQYGLWLDYDIYTNHNQWYLVGRSRIQDFPLQYYGIGNKSAPSDAVTVESSSLIFRQRVMYQFARNWFFGPEFDLEILRKVHFLRGDTLLPDEELPIGGKGVANIGAGLTLEYDTRQNQLNVREGLFAGLSVLTYQKALGSDQNFWNMIFDMRYYAHPFHPKQVWASQLYSNLVFGEAPFNQLALMGGESLMRGYYMGRYRDKAYVAAQSEYRFLPFPFSKRIGASLFLSAGAVAESPGKLARSTPRLAGGGGLRYLIFPKEDIFVRLDVGFTGEGSGFYVFLGEAF